MGSRFRSTSGATLGGIPPNSTVTVYYHTVNFTRGSNTFDCTKTKKFIQHNM